jgi:chemotaxis protein CheD
MSLTETMVRMGEYAVSGNGEALVSIGLGSCIGLALVDPARGVAGLAHVMLPASPPAGDAQLGKYADTALPMLLEEVLALGARRARLDAVLVGGAQMFSFGGGALDVGARNQAATRAALESARLPIRATAVGGSTGRTIRVHPSTGTVTVKCAGSPEVELFSSAGKRR